MVSSLHAVPGLNTFGQWPQETEAKQIDICLKWNANSCTILLGSVSIIMMAMFNVSTVFNLFNVLYVLYGLYSRLLSNRKHDEPP